MDFIEGRSLAELVRDRPLERRGPEPLFDVAEAIASPTAGRAAPRSQPANVMITRKTSRT